jgi:DNA-binding NarL/FixJ family response regulator
VKEIRTEYTQEKGEKMVMIVDDHPIILEGLSKIINREPDLLVCAAVGSIEEAVKAVKKQKIDLALVDMMLNHTTGIEVIKKIKTLRPGLIALIFSMSDKSQDVKQAIEAGARGYITKDEISEDIVNAIRKILTGKIYISRGLLENLPKEELDGLFVGKVQGCCD